MSPFRICTSVIKAFTILISYAAHTSSTAHKKRNIHINEFYKEPQYMTTLHTSMLGEKRFSKYTEWVIFEIVKIRWDGIMGLVLSPFFSASKVISIHLLILSSEGYHYIIRSKSNVKRATL